MSFERLLARADALGFFNRRAVLAVLALVVTVAVGSGLFWSFSAAAQAQSGTPTPISTAADLRGIVDDLDGNYVLVNDISLLDSDGDRVSWTPLGGTGGSAGGTVEPFSGVFDGGGFEISGLQADTQLNCRFGLFGFVDGGTVRNVGLRDVFVSSTSDCNSNAFGTVGGLVATLRDGRVESSYVVDGTVEGSVFVGGLVGRLAAPTGSNSTIVANSFTNVTVQGGSSTTTNRGGLVGFSAGEIRSSYALGDASGMGSVGGLVSDNSGGTITNSFAAEGAVVSGSGNGGLVGGSDAGTVVMSYQTSDSSDADYYLSLAALRSAGASTGGFENWEDDVCPNNAVVGSGAPVWDFGRGNELPSISCIRGAAQPRTPAGFTEISDAAGLRAIANNLDGDYILTNDIDLQSANWTPLGGARSAGFTGTFDGGGYEISNLLVTGADVGAECHAGLFGVIEGGVVRNVGLRDVSVSNELEGCRTVSGDTSGALAGAVIAAGIVRASYVVGGTVKGYDNVGGLIGQLTQEIGVLDRVKLFNSFADVTVEGLQGGFNRGGLVGSLNFKSDIQSSYSLGDVGGSGSNFGGLVGYVIADLGIAVRLVNSFTTSSVRDTSTSRGLIGVAEQRGGTFLGNISNNSQTTRSGDPSYRSFASLLRVSRSTGGLGGDNCGSEAVAGAGGRVWDFGEAYERPRINCIAADVVQGVVVPTVTVTGVTDGETVNKDDSIELTFTLDVDPATPVPVRVGVEFGANLSLVENEDYTIDTDVVELTSAGDTAVSRITYITESVEPIMSLLAEIRYELPNGEMTGARLGEMLTTVNLVNPGFTPISTAAELRAIADTPESLSDNYILTNDISLLDENGETVSWTPLSASATVGFSGVFDGRGYEISDLWTNTAVSCGIGLFGVIRGTVRNLGLRDVYVTSEGSGCTANNAGIGALAGSVFGGRVEASYVVGGTVRGHARGTGGLVGQLTSGAVVDSFTNVEVVGFNTGTTAGGLVGRMANQTAIVRTSYALGDVSGIGSVFGGLAGFNGGRIRRSFATGSVAGGATNGGLLGENDTFNIQPASESYQTLDSGGDYYRSLSDLAAAMVVGVAGFGTWDDDMCADDAVVGAGERVWDFRAVGELPQISCISAAAQLPPLTVDTVGGERTFSEAVAAVDLVVSIDKTPALGDVLVRLMPTSDDGLIEGVDYTLSSAAVTFAMGTSVLSQMVTLTLNTDDEVEEAESRTLSIGYVVGADAVVAVGSPLDLVILDDDTPEITLDVSGGTSSFQTVEDGGDFVVTVRASKTLRNPIELTVSEVADGTATAGSDFDYTVTPRVVTLAPSGEATVAVDVLTDDVDEVDEFVSLLFAITDAGASRASVASGSVRLRVRDVNVPQLSFSPATLNLMEGGSDVMFTVDSDIAVVADVAVDVAVVAGDSASQFSISPTSVTIAAGETVSGVVTLSATDDGNPEVTEGVRLGLSLSSGEATLPASDLVVMVIDDDVPLVTVDTVGGVRTFGETAAAVDLGVSIDNMPVGAVMVTLMPSSDDGLMEGVDYTLAPALVTFAAGTSALTETVTLTLINDEAEEELLRTLSIGYVVAGMAAAVGSPLELEIMDDDTPEITLAVSGGTSSFQAVEGGADVVVTVRASKTLRNPIELTVSDGSDGTATAGSGFDYTVMPRVVTLAPSGEATVRVAVLTDEEDEVDEFVSLLFAITSAGNSRAIVGSGTVRLRVMDTPYATVSVANSGATTISEDVGSVVLDVTLSDAPMGGSVTVNLTASGGDLVEGVNGDYTLSRNFVTFAAGTASLTEQVTLTLIDDEVEEALSRMLSIALDITATGSAAASVSSPLELTIMDDDTPIITIESDADSVDEGGSATLTFTVSRSPRAAVTVSLVVPNERSSDVSLSGDGSVTFQQGVVASSTRTLTFRALDDELDEPDEMVGLTITRSGGAGSRAMVAVGTIVDITVVDTTVPQLSFNPPTLDLMEGGSDVTFTVVSDVAVLADVVVDVEVAGGGATNQFNISPSSVTIPAGGTTSGVVTLSATDNGDPEGTDAVSLTLDVTSGEATVPASDLVVSVIDDDAPLVSVVLASGFATTVNEGDVVTLEVRLSNGLAGSSVGVSLSPTGLAADEYTLSQNFVTFAAGATGNDLVEEVTLTLVDDEVEEALSRELSIGYTAAPSADVVAGSALVLTLMDDDAPIITVSPVASSLDEGEMVTLTFTVDKSPSAPVTVSVGQSGGGDASLPDGGSVNFPAGATGNDRTQTLTFRALNDDLDELDENVAVTFAVTAPNSRAMVAAGTSVSITVVDTDVPQLSFSPRSLDLGEGETVTFTVVSDIAVLADVVVDVAVVGGGASQFSINPTSVTIPAGGTTSGVVTLTSQDDSVAEVQVDVSLRLSLSSGEAILPADLVVTVIDDDAPTVSVTGIMDDQVFTEGDSVELTFGLDIMPSAPVTVRVTIAGTGLVAGTDYRIDPAAGVRLRSGGDSAVVTIMFLDDGEDYETRTVEIAYRVTAGAAVLSPSGATVSLVDAESPPDRAEEVQTSKVVMLPAFTRVDLSDIEGTVGGGSLRARLDYEAGGGVLYPTTVGWPIASGSNVFSLMTLDDPFSVVLTFEAEGMDEIEVVVRQIGAPTEEWRVTGTVTTMAFVPPSPPKPTDKTETSETTVGLDSGDEVTIDVPVGASNDFLRVEVVDVPRSALNSLPSLPSGVEILPDAVVLDIDLMDSNNAEVRRVNRPTRVCLPLSAADYGQVANPALLRVITYHEGASGWDVLNSEYDVEAEQLCAYTSRFSVFAIGLASPQFASDGLFLPSTGDGGVLGLWGVAGLGVFGSVLILAGVLVVVRRKFPNFRSARS